MSSTSIFIHPELKRWRESRIYREKIEFFQPDYEIATHRREIVVPTINSNIPPSSSHQQQQQLQEDSAAAPTNNKKNSSLLQKQQQSL